MDDEKQKWLEERRKGIGGSDTPVVLGVSPFKTRLELWREKRGLAEDVEPTPAMKRGTVLEPVIADLYSEATGRKLRRRKQSLQDKQFPFLRANIDREIVGNGNPGVMEIKCPGLRVFSQCKREGVPDYYQVQLQHYLAVTGRKWGSLAIFNAERWELLFFDVERDDEIINIIRVKDAEFWQMVKEGVPPEDEPQPVLDLPKIAAEEVIKFETSEWAKAVERYKEAKALRQEAETLETEAKQVLQKMMDEQGAEIAEGAGIRVYWKWQDGRERINTKKLKKEHPEIYAKYSKKGKSFRSFRPYVLKETINE